MMSFTQKSLVAALAASFAIGAMAADPPDHPAIPPDHPAIAGAAPAADSAKPAEPLDKTKVSTMVGMDIGHSLIQIKDDIDVKAVETALEQTLRGEKTSLTQEESMQIRQQFMQQMQAKRVAEQKAEADKNKTDGAKFLAENKGKPGVKTTASGLQYLVEKEGTGPKPKETDTVKVNYLGTKIDGEKFDSSYDRGEPATFPLNGVIKGWTEGLQLMTVGSKYKLFLPSDLAYGENGPPKIGPNAALVFEVELLSIEKPADAADAPAKAGAAKPATSEAAPAKANAAKPVAKPAATKATKQE
ncbi:MAG: FKBP-type peptidyl-prolyl cis-trans isomerase [Rhodanobacter sp.]|nr:FKBP-type peptidyl-prolyl cis-trans isomerase [Rhodanobacter sp.]